jgi:hypothetical protein
MARSVRRDRIIEIIKDITGLLGAGVELLVLEKIDDLRKWKPEPLWGYYKENKKSAAAVRKWIEKLHAALEKFPDVRMLFAPENSDDLDLDTMLQETADRGRAFMESLGKLHTRCESIEASIKARKKPGAHRSLDPLQKQVAIEARLLMEACGKTATDGSAGSTFGKVGSLLFEAVTGEIDKDLQRACKAVRTVRIRTEN